MSLDKNQLLELSRRLPPHVLRWLYARGISEDVAYSAGLHMALRSIVIPVIGPKGRLFNKYRRDPAIDHDQKFFFDPGSKRTLYRAETVPDASLLFICEGELDALRAVSDGFHAVSSTNGARSWDHKWSPLFFGKTVIVWYDADVAGLAGGHEVANSVSAYADKTYIVQHDPALGKDLTEVLCGLGKSLSVKLLKSTPGISLEIHKHIPSKVRRQSGERTRDENPDLTPVLLAYGGRDIGRSMRCVIHNDRNPSMSVDFDQGLWYCHACKVGGSAYDLIMQLENCSFLEAKKILATI